MAPGGPWFFLSIPATDRLDFAADLKEQRPVIVGDVGTIWVVPPTGTSGLVG